MDSPRRSPRIAERNGAAPRRHMALGDHHPQAEMFRAKRDIDRHADERNFLCLVTLIVAGMWSAFLGTLAYNEWKEGRLPLNWEIQSGWLNP